MKINNQRLTSELASALDQKVQDILSDFCKAVGSYRPEVTAGVNVHYFRSSAATSITGSFIKSRAGDILVVNVTVFEREGLMKIEVDIGVDKGEDSVQIVSGPSATLLLSVNKDIALDQVSKWSNDLEAFLIQHTELIVSEIDSLE